MASSTGGKPIVLWGVAGAQSNGRTDRITIAIISYVIVTSRSLATDTRANGFGAASERCAQSISHTQLPIKVFARKRTEPLVCVRH